MKSSRERRCYLCGSAGEGQHEVVRRSGPFFGRRKGATLCDSCWRLQRTFTRRSSRAQAVAIGALLVNIMLRGLQQTCLEPVALVFLCVAAGAFLVAAWIAHQHNREVEWRRRL